MEEVLSIRVSLEHSYEVEGGTEKAVMILFHGEADSPYFRGIILPGGVDTQWLDASGKRTLSARYILEGTDRDGEKCRLFIENEAEAQEGEDVVTHPRVITDSIALKWMETAPLIGTITSEKDRIGIHIFLQDS